MRRRHLTLVTLLLLAAMATAPACTQPPAARALLLAQIAQGYTSAHTVSLPKAIKLAVAAHRAVRKSRPTVDAAADSLPWEPPDSLDGDAGSVTRPVEKVNGDPQTFLCAPSRAHAPPAVA